MCSSIHRNRDEPCRESNLSVDAALPSAVMETFFTCILVTANRRAEKARCSRQSEEAMSCGFARCR